MCATVRGMAHENSLAEIKDFLDNWPRGSLTFNLEGVRRFADSVDVPVSTYLASELNRAADGYFNDKKAVEQYKKLPSPSSRQKKFHSISGAANKLARLLSGLHETDRRLLAVSSGDNGLPPLGNLPQRLEQDSRTMAEFADAAANRIEVGRRGDKPDMALHLWVPILCITYQNITGEKAGVNYKDENSSYEGHFLDWVDEFLRKVDSTALKERSRSALGQQIKRFLKDNPDLRKRFLTDKPDLQKRT